MHICWRPAVLLPPPGSRRSTSSGFCWAMDNPTSADSVERPTSVRRQSGFSAVCGGADRLQLGLLRLERRVPPLRPGIGPQRKSVPLQFRPGQHRLIRKSPPPGKAVLKMEARAPSLVQGAAQAQRSAGYGCSKSPKHEARNSRLRCRTNGALALAPPFTTAHLP